jgi:hypothetical protein
MQVQISSKLRKYASEDGLEEGLIYWCEGCETTHSIRTKGPGAWEWNGDVEKPVFSPSVLTKMGHYAYDYKKEKCWCTFDWSKYPNVPRSKCQLCHTFVGCNGAQPGEIIFLSDCTHELKSQVRPFPDLPDPYKDH